MSRIGQKIIEIPDNVEANLGQDEIKLTGPKGELSAPIFEGASIGIADKTITVNKGADNQGFSKNWNKQNSFKQLKTYCTLTYKNYEVQMKTI